MLAHCRTWPLLKRLVEGQIGTLAEIADGLASRAPGQSSARATASSLISLQSVPPASDRSCSFDVDTWPGCYGRLIGHSRSFGCWRWYR